jgi:hypothetical protein
MVMYRNHFIFCALLMMPALPTLVRANDNNTHNVRCFLATAQLSGSTDKNIATIGWGASLFFAGKIYGSNPNIDLLDAARQELPAMTTEVTKALLVECGAEMQGRGNQISAAGQGLINDAVKQSGSTAPE